MIRPARAADAPALAALLNHWILNTAVTFTPVPKTEGDILDMIAAKLKPGGEFRFGTDHPVYIRWAMMQMNARRDFEWQIAHASDFLTRPDDWPETRYERKARTVYGHEVWYFRWRRI